MEQLELITQTKRIIEKPQDAAGLYAEACELLRVYAGANSSFLESVKIYNPHSPSNRQSAHHNIKQVLLAFVSYLEAGLNTAVSPQRQAQLDVVSDFLEMAGNLVRNKDVHPAAAAVVVGATLEEFLRTWIDAEKLPLGNRKPGLETYSQVLRDAELITKQDGKDITAWAGIRNHAAHGEWDEVSDRTRINIMLEGVNLFMRKYTP